MKSPSFILLILVALFSFSCVDDINTIGTGIQPKSDEIKIGTDTFYVATDNVFVDSIYSRQDSLLLGTFYNKTYGSTQADIFAQVNCPVGFKYPLGTVPDSAVVTMYYRSWFGDSYSPLDVSIYEMTEKTFDYSTPYPSNINPTDYTNKSIKLGQKIFTAKDAAGTRVSANSIDFKLSNDFVQRFSNDSNYKSESKFANFFKGMYITANFGASTILNIARINLDYYYHYTVRKNGKDTIIKDVKTFPANSEVRQVNRFVHSDRSTLVKQLDSINYIASPANLQTRVKLPLKRMKERIDAVLLSRNRMLNSALLNVEAVNVDMATLAMPIVEYLLLIKESEVDEFFKKNKLPVESTAVVAKFSNSKNNYTLDIAKIVSTELKNNSNPDEYLNMMLVPVRIKLDANKNVVEVKPQFLMSAVTIRSGKNVYSPMRINMFFSGF